MTFTFKAEKREGKLKDSELCMGVVSGPEQESTALQFNLKDFKKLLGEAGQANIVTLEGLEKPVEVTIHHVDYAPFTNEIRHVEFYALKRGAEMNADIPLNYVGEAPAVKLDATINKILRSLSITCKPKDLIQEVEVDLSKLAEIGDTITIKDLSIPKSVKVNHEPDAGVVTAMAPKSEKKEEETPTEEVSSEESDSTESTGESSDSKETEAVNEG